MHEELQYLIDNYLTRNELHAGYPVNFAFDFQELAPFFKYHLNNAGDPFLVLEDGQGKPNHNRDPKKIERLCIQEFAKMYQLDDFWGYITAGGTEGNIQGIFLARECLKSATLYFSEDSHYSIKKAARLLQVPYVVIRSSANGEMDYKDFEEQLHLNQQRKAIVNVNFGTTMKGAVDSVDKIVNILERNGVEYYLHCDAALGGMLLPFMEGAPKISFTDWPIGSIVISGHKFLGSPIPYGIFLCRKNYINYQEKIEYIDSYDTTISGSRSGLAPILCWYSLYGSGRNLKAEVMNCVENARYLYKRLKEGNTPDLLLNPFSTTVVFRKPTREICEKWQLASEGNLSHAVIMQHVSHDMVTMLADDILNQRYE